MKNLLKFLSFAALMTFLATSCNTDPCKDIVCGDFGACDEGICICNAGYEQDADGLCNVEMREKFIAIFTVDDSCTTTGNDSYTITINKPTDASAGITEITISEFWEFNAKIEATVSGSTISIARQEPDSDGFYVEGEGTISSDETTVTMTFKATNENDPQNIIIDDCSTTWTKN